MYLFSFSVFREPRYGGRFRRITYKYVLAASRLIISGILFQKLWPLTRKTNAVLRSPFVVVSEKTHAVLSYTAARLFARAFPLYRTVNAMTFDTRRLHAIHTHYNNIGVGRSRVGHRAEKPRLGNRFATDVTEGLPADRVYGQKPNLTYP